MSIEWATIETELHLFGTSVTVKRGVKLLYLLFYFKVLVQTFKGIVLLITNSLLRIQTVNQLFRLQQKYCHRLFLISVLSLWMGICTVLLFHSSAGNFSI